MNTESMLSPDYIFESSWEVCNKVGGIYTVLSTRAKTLHATHKDNLIFIGPDVWKEKENPLFIESKTVLASWKKHATQTEQLGIRVGRWNIPGKPIVILVDFEPFFAQKEEIYTLMWNLYQVDSLHGYGDYDEASMFAFAAGKVIESYYRFHLTSADKVIAQFHEWMTGIGALYLQHATPQIASVFTTHATSIGRSIAGNHKPLYHYLEGYNGDQMAHELNMESKHSIEKQAAHHVDCFTTVSDITNKECTQLLERKADVVLMNGFEDNFVPKPKAFEAQRKEARKKLLNVAQNILGCEVAEDTILLTTSGRYEYKNKGIDVFLETINKLNHDASLQKDIIAYINVPAWSAGAREDLANRLASEKTATEPLNCPFLTHWLFDADHDNVLLAIRRLGITNHPTDRVKVIFAPCYLDGQDGIFNINYYDLLIGMDLTVYPSYYEPWGYTPLESVAFHIPTITTDLAGFGLWVQTLNAQTNLKSGVEVIHRSDNNYMEVAEAIHKVVIDFTQHTEKEIQSIRNEAAQVAEKALWKHFISYYETAYHIALTNAAIRTKTQLY